MNHPLMARAMPASLKHELLDSLRKGGAPHYGVHGRRGESLAGGPDRDEEHSGAHGDAHGRIPRRLQTSQQLEVEAAYQAMLLKPHWDLTDEEKLSVVPVWQRQLLLPQERELEDAFELMQAHIVRRYGESACNASYGCNLLYGQCLNVTGGDVYLYDQNGTCRCHHWFEGADCSQIIISGDTCTYNDPETLGPDALDSESCAYIRHNIYSTRGQDRASELGIGIRQSEYIRRHRMRHQIRTGSPTPPHPARVSSLSKLSRSLCGVDQSYRLRLYSDSVRCAVLTNKGPHDRMNPIPYPLTSVLPRECCV